MLYESTVNVPEDEMRPPKSGITGLSSSLTEIKRRGVGDGAGITRDVNRPTSNQVSPLLCVTAAGYNGVAPFAKLPADCDGGKPHWQHVHAKHGDAAMNLQNT
nr:hypothetical protein Iba_chr14aCG14840 [Ipomoea batatas]